MRPFSRQDAHPAVSPQASAAGRAPSRGYLAPHQPTVSPGSRALSPAFYTFSSFSHLSGFGSLVLWRLAFPFFPDPPGRHLERRSSPRYRLSRFGKDFAGITDACTNTLDTGVVVWDLDHTATTLAAQRCISHLRRAPFVGIFPPVCVFRGTRPSRSLNSASPRGRQVARPRTSRRASCGRCARKSSR